MTEMPMFPLSSVLFPHMPLPLRIFEQRYLAMLARVLQDEPAEFGQVLIERGQESGGGEARFGIGTVAQITELEGAEESVLVISQGVERFEVEEWLEDDPYPRATIRRLPELEWDEELAPLRERAEEVVRRIIVKVEAIGDHPWSSDVVLDDDPVAACWQLAAIAPLGPLDQLRLLRSTTLRDLLSETIELALGVEVVLDLE